MTDIVIADLPRSANEWLRVSVSDFRGKRRIDVRVFARYRDGKTVGPTPKGISVGLERLPELITALQEAEAQAAHADPPTDKPTTR